MGLEIYIIVLKLKFAEFRRINAFQMVVISNKIAFAEFGRIL